MPETNADDQRLTDILTNPANDPAGNAQTREDMLEDLTEMASYEDAFGVDDIDLVAGRLRTHYDRELRTAAGVGEFDLVDGEMRFWFISDSEGIVGMYGIGVHVGQARYYSTAHDIKHASSDRLSSGLDAALGYARNLEGDYLRILADARAAGLITDPAAQ